MSSDAPSPESSLELEDGYPSRRRDRHGHEAWSADWRGGELVELRLVTPRRERVTVRPDIGTHPLFGRCGGVYVERESEPRARFAAIDWAAPSHIMPVDVPAALPPGAGTAILNFVALMAKWARRAFLRYRGPYPTAALFDTLMASFRPATETAQALASFTTDVERRARSGEMIEVPVDFIPSPHVWTWTSPEVCVQQRGSIERLYVGGISYDRILASHRTLVAESDGTSTRWCARIDIAGRPWVEVMRVGTQGETLEGPHPLPPVDSGLIGEALPPEVIQVLTEIVISRAPAMLAGPLRDVLTDRAVVWADTGVELGRVREDRFELHAVLGERLPELDARAMLVHLGGALEPLARRAAQAHLAAQTAPEAGAQPQSTKGPR